MDHKRISRVVRREGELIHLYPRGDLRHGGAMLAAWGLGISLALALSAGALSFFSGALALQLVVGAVIGACVGSIGLGMWRLASFNITLDPEATTYSQVARKDTEAPVAGEPGKGKIRLPGVEIAFDTVRAVHIRAKATISTGGEAQAAASDEAYQVDVVVHQESGDEEHEALLERIRRLAEAPSEAETGAGESTDEVKLDELVQQLETSSVEIAQQADGLSAWLVAEALASTIGVPFFDSCGERALFRLPHELDLPLVERLRQYDAPTHPQVPPPRMEAALDQNGLRASWREGSLGVILPSIAGVMLLGSGLLAQVFLFEALPLLGTGAVMLLLALLVFTLKGRHQLRVDGEGVSFKRRLRRERKIPLAELEAVRVSKVLLPKTLLISDAELLSFPMPSAEAARWLHQAVERAIWTVRPSRPQVGPYR